MNPSDFPKLDDVIGDNPKYTGWIRNDREVYSYLENRQETRTIRFNEETLSKNEKHHSLTGPAYMTFDKVFTWNGSDFVLPRGARMIDKEFCIHGKYVTIEEYFKNLEVIEQENKVKIQDRMNKLFKDKS